VSRSAGQAFFQELGHHLVESHITFLRHGVDLLHEIEVELDREGDEALCLIEFALLAPVRGNSGVIAEASRRDGLLHRAAEFQSLEFIQFGFFHILTSLFNRETALYSERLSNLSQNAPLGNSRSIHTSSPPALRAFVDIGVHQDGLVHVSALANTFIKDAHEVVKPGQIVKVKVMEVDVKRQRIALTMRLDDAPGASSRSGGAVATGAGANFLTVAGTLATSPWTTQVSLAANTVLTLDVDAQELGSLLDSVLEVVAPGGAVIASNDDDLRTFDSALAVRIPADGNYTIRITDFQQRTGANLFFLLKGSVVPAL